MLHIYKKMLSFWKVCICGKNIYICIHNLKQFLSTVYLVYRRFCFPFAPICFVIVNAHPGTIHLHQSLHPTNVENDCLNFDSTYMRRTFFLKVCTYLFFFFTYMNQFCCNSYVTKKICCCFQWRLLRLLFTAIGGCYQLLYGPC